VGNVDDMRQRRRYIAVNDEAEGDVEEYQQTHRRLSDRVERLLMQLVILGLVGLVLVQSMALYPPVRRMINLLEGQDGYALQQDSPVWQQLVERARSTLTAANEEPQPQVVPAGAAAANLSITVVLMNAPSAPQAKLLVGGKVAGHFEGGTVTCPVQAGQMVAVDGTGTDQELTFRVVAAPGLSQPVLGHEVTTRGNRQNVGMVRPAQ